MSVFSIIHQPREITDSLQKGHDVSCVSLKTQTFLKWSTNVCMCHATVSSLQKTNKCQTWLYCYSILCVSMSSHQYEFSPKKFSDNILLSGEKRKSTFHWDIFLHRVHSEIVVAVLKNRITLSPVMFTGMLWVGEPDKTVKTLFFYVWWRRVDRLKKKKMNKAHYEEKCPWIELYGFTE